MGRKTSFPVRQLFSDARGVHATCHTLGLNILGSRAGQFMGHNIGQVPLKLAALSDSGILNGRIQDRVISNRRAFNFHAKRFKTGVS